MSNEEEPHQFHIASMPTRLFTYIFDQLVIVIIVSQDFFTSRINLGDLQKASITSLLMLMMISTMYYFICEYFLSKTLGKYITRTKVVDEEGEKPSITSILIRSLCRNIPLDNLSFLFFSIGWHDRLSNTRVVYDRFRVVGKTN